MYSISFFPVYCKFCWFFWLHILWFVSNVTVSVYGMCILLWQAYAAEAGTERAEEPMEEAGMSDEIIQKAGIVYCRDSLSWIFHFTFCFLC